MKHKLYIQPFFVLCLALLAATANAQMVSGNVFLKGHYVEAGITTLGSFGAALPPAGYHPFPAGSSLGFVADPAMDGWTVGTPPYFGDYFYPGSPYEGWDIQVDSNIGNATTEAGAFSGGLTGVNTSYSASGSSLTAVWQGTFHGLSIQQVTTMDTLSLYFRITVTLTNTDVIAHNNIYYFRGLDPDNDETRGGSFATNNTVVYNQPTDSVSLVTATGTDYPEAYLALGSADTNARAVIFNDWPLSFYLSPAGSNNLAEIFDGTSSIGAVYSGSDNGDIGIGIVFNIGHLAPLDSAADSVGRTTSGLHPANSQTFSYFYSFSPAASDSALAAGPTGTRPTAITYTNLPTDIQVFPNPFTNVLNVTGLSLNDHVQVVDMMGRTLYTRVNAASNSMASFTLSGLSTGTYLFIVSDQEGRIKARVPLQKN